MKRADPATVPEIAAPAPTGAGWRGVTSTSPADLRRYLAAHATDVDLPPAREAGGPSLGPLHGLSHTPPPAAPWQLGEAGAAAERLRRNRRRSPPLLHAGSRRPWCRDLADLEAVPVLSTWARRRIAAGLADRPGESPATQSGGDQDRLGKCCNNVRRTAGDLSMFRTSSGAWSWSGTVTCDEWCCPRCAPARARAEAKRLESLLDRWCRRDTTHLTSRDAWMLTLTTTHDAYDDPSLTVSTLYAAHAAFTRSAAWRRFRARWGIASTVRCLDVVFGGDAGPHPHFHIAVLPSLATVTGDERRAAALAAVCPSAPAGASPAQLAQLDATRRRIDADRVRASASPWSSSRLTDLDDHERGVVLASVERDIREAWRDAVEGVSGTRPASSACLRLTPGEDAARYFTAWGLSAEVSATPIKSRSHLRLLDAAGAGDAAAGAEWQGWRAAVRGRSWVTGLTDALNRAGITTDDIAADHREREARRAKVEAEAIALGLREPRRIVRELLVTIPAYLAPAATAIGPEQLERLADLADARGGDAAAWVSDALHERWLAIAAWSRPEPEPRQEPPWTS